ncbi:hypothetical protein EDD94_6186 [Streptomyces sp. PanSC9]|nr:hypothetical protein EDD94_6186 [Streptomyces sp. PanSC9]
MRRSVHAVRTASPAPGRAPAPARSRRPPAAPHEGHGDRGTASVPRTGGRPPAPAGATGRAVPGDLRPPDRTIPAAEPQDAQKPEMQP